MKKLVINFLGAPSAGKSVAATSIFAQLKKQNVDVLYVGEFAKDLVVEDNKLALRNQLYVWATQYHRIFCAHEHAQITVTDSPILLGLFYQNETTHKSIHEVILSCHKEFNNVNILVELDTNRPYSMTGRVHTLDQSLKIQ